MKKVIIAFIIWRVLTLLVALISPFFIPTFGATFPYYQERLISTNFPHFIWSLGNFDGVHYLGIAKEGYAAQFTQAFFPFYPILIKIFSFLTFGNLFISAVLISNISFLIGLLGCYKLLKVHYSEKIPFWAIVFILSFPTSFFFGSIYTEGLFFLLTISTFYLIEKNHLALAAIIGSLAASTRLIGSFLIITFVSSRRCLRNYIYASLIPLGLIAYMSYLQFKFQNPIYFLTSQSAFGQDRTTQNVVLLPQVIYRYFKILTTTSGLTFASALFELLSTIFALFILILAYKKVKKSWVIFSFITVIIPTLTGTLASMPRYVLMAFPIFIVLALIKSSVIKALILIVFIVLGVASLALFSRGYWVA